MEKRRHIVLINKTFQFRLIFKFILVNTVITLLSGSLIYVFFNSEINANLQTAHVTYTNMKNMLLPIIFTISVLNVLVSSLIIFIFVLFASHKIAGPIFRFHQALKEISDRNFKTFTSIREDDQLYECSAALKEVVKVLSDDLSQIKIKISEIEGISKKKESTSDVKDIVKQIEDIIDKYKIAG